MTHTPSSGPTRTRTIARHTTATLLGALFALSGLMKLAGPGLVGVTVYGLPTWFAYLVGGVEVSAGLLLAVPALRPYAAGALTTIMLGAIGAHVTATEWNLLALPLALAAAALAVGWVHRPVWFRTQIEQRRATPTH